ncbi:MAG TPA: hypothetical protein VFA18_02770 [Gemmataceae bacterium]|nr:hypothetical protein [Gemmataceae bacterium]
MPFAAPASVAAACGNQGHAGKCSFWGRLRRRVAVEPAPNGCNAFYPGFTAGCAGCGDNQPARHHHRRGESWWARFSRQQLCCPPNADGVMEYTCGGCNSGCDNGCDGCNTAPTPAPTPAHPAAPPKPLPRKATQAITPQDLGTGLSVLQDPIGQN